MVDRRRAACAVQVFAFYILCSLADDTLSNVIKYDFETFFDQVPTKNTFVMFFAPWCGHCKRLAPTWDELGAKYNKNRKNDVTIAKVDCTSDQEVCSTEGITGYPTLKFFPAGKGAIRYKGPRDLESLEDFLNDQIGNNMRIKTSADKVIFEDGLVELTDSTFHDHTANGLHFVEFYAPWCGHCQKLAPTWDNLAQTKEKNPPDVSISKIDCVSNRHVCNEYGITGYPTLMWFRDGHLVEKYQGGRKLDELQNYVDEMRSKFLELDNTPGEVKSKFSEQQENTADEEARMPDRVPPSVMALDSSNFSTSIAKGVTFVKFYAPWCGHCKRLAPTWESLARRLIGQKVTVAEVDCTVTSCKELCLNQKVEGYPTMILYKNGKLVKEYNGNRDLDSLFDFVMKYLQREEL